ncbi:MAG: glycine cleavage system protein GcvH [Anaerolineaceae bacterium]|jgi:glycine cleavage system H protein|nr:glycine cleavage system protein GcvH [Anaerolineaceae bacterium]HNX45988.1 glycine cleavage system protein GcvH [Anaerolineaceae bacterium]HPT23112.1 glycine cleavage system protein GcvH [Anaerolineaceae bacterium]
MLFPKDLKYQKTDEWVKVENGIATIGISDYAQDSLSDIVYVEFAVDPGDSVEAGANLATIESVKAAAEVLFPVSGTVLEINEGLADKPEILNSDPYGAAWLVKVKVADETELAGLLDSEAYEAYCQER